MSHKVLLKHLLTGRPAVVYPKYDEEGILIRLQDDKLVSFTYDLDTRQWSKHLTLGPLEFLTSRYVGYNLNIRESGTMPEHCDEVYESQLAVSDRQFIRDLISNAISQITVTNGTYYIGLDENGMFFIMNEEQKEIKAKEEAKKQEVKRFQDFLASESHSTNYLDEHELSKLLEPEQAIVVECDGTIYAYQITNFNLQSFRLIDGTWYRKNTSSVMDLLNLKVSKFLLIPYIRDFIDDVVVEHGNGLNITDQAIIRMFIEHGHVIYQSKEKLNIFKLSQRGSLVYNNWLDYSSNFPTLVCTKNQLPVNDRLQRLKMDLLWDHDIDITRVKKDQLTIRLNHVFKYIEQPVFRFILCSLYGLLDHQIKTISEISNYLDVDDRKVFSILTNGIDELKKFRRIYILKHGIPDIDVSVIETSDLPSHLMMSNNDIIRIYRDKAINEEELI